MLHEFLNVHRDELISRCREKVAGRFAPSSVPEAIDLGVPLLLLQIAASLRDEQQLTEPAHTGLEKVQAEIGQGAAAHGAELLRLGYTIDQVVHDYGDVCQAVTEMAIELKAPISTTEFHTLNRCLDDAIAGAVMAFGTARQTSIDNRTDTIRGRLGAFTAEHRRLLGVAMHSFAAIRTGDMSVGGATGKLLVQSLNDLRILTETALPQIQLLAEASTTASHR